MKIILLTSSLDLGGTERVVASLCNEWAERGHDVTLILTYSGGAKMFYPLSDRTELINLANVVGVKNLGILAYAQRLYALRRLIAERSADVLVSFLPNVNIAAILSSAFLRVPLIICERSYPLSIPKFHVLNVLRKRTYRYADLLTVQTDSIADKFKKLYPGLKSVHTIPNALPAEINGYKKSTGRERKILLSLGRLAPEKQVDKLLNTFSLIAPMFPEWDLHIYGDGPLKASLDAQIRQAGLQSRVFLKGATAKPWEVMANADAFAMVSQYEGFPNALLEAMGIGLPCVVFDCPTGPKEITRDGKDALLVPLNDFGALQTALKQLMGNEALRIRLGAQARESVFKRFSHEQVMTLWDQLFKQVGAIQ
jgi:glycosyltransferase involved in cell wall biosynthesis